MASSQELRWSLVSKLSMETSTSDALVPHTYEAGFVVLSYFVSAVGCWTSLELLNKRTSSRGWYNWYLLFAAATTMGAVAIWSMHFIGNRAVSIGNGDPAIQIAYSPGFTAGSFFLPILFVGVAFYTFTISEVVSMLRTILGGSITGSAICGMHYMGQAGIANYNNVFDWRFILGAAIIAIVAATTALGVFFHLKSAWTNSWWRRVLCGALLAAAVSGMHWVATIGTSYTFRAGVDPASSGLSRTQTVAVVAILAVSCCVILVIVALVAQRSKKINAARAQQVVLACATFDHEGRILITPEISLPCRKITNSYIQETLDDDFSVQHPVYTWLFRVTRNWKSVLDLVPGMRLHVRHREAMRDNYNGRSNMGTDDSYATVFKELFCIAAQDLASTLDQPLENLGVLYDKIVESGTVRQRKRKGNSNSHPSTGMNTPTDVERGNSAKMIFGRGQVLFVVRQADKVEASQLQAAGYNFAPIQSVIETLARSMQVTSGELRPYLEDLKTYPMTPAMYQPGVHVAAVIMRPLLHRGFDVLVNRAAPNLLPSFPLARDQMSDADITTIQQYGDLELSAIYSSMHHGGKDSRSLFMDEVLKASAGLEKIIGNDILKSSRLCAEVLEAPCRPDRDSFGKLKTAKLIIFRLITDIHQAQITTGLAEFSPTQLLLAHQHIYPQSPSHEILTRRIHIEFANLVKRSSGAAGMDSTTTAIGLKGFTTFMPRTPTWGRSHSYSKNGSKLSTHENSPRRSENTTLGEDHDTGSEKNLVNSSVMRSQNLGGIHVSNELTIDVREVDPRKNSRGSEEDKPRSNISTGTIGPKDIELSPLGIMPMGVRSEAMRAGAPVEPETYIDILMCLMMQERADGRWAAGKMTS